MVFQLPTERFRYVALACRRTTRRSVRRKLWVLSNSHEAIAIEHDCDRTQRRGVVQVCQPLPAAPLPFLELAASGELAVPFGLDIPLADCLGRTFPRLVHVLIGCSPNLVRIQ